MGGLEKEKWGSMNFKRMMHFGSFRRSGHGANRGETNYSLTDAHIALGKEWKGPGTFSINLSTGQFKCLRESCGLMEI